MLCNSLHPITANNHNNIMQFVTPHHCQSKTTMYSLTTTVRTLPSMQDYNRVFGEPSDICTDCGASPQDVRHLFACTTHPTDLSPEDLWRNPVRSIRAFSYLETETLTDLKTDLVVANNNNNNCQ